MVKSYDEIGDLTQFLSRTLWDPFLEPNPVIITRHYSNRETKYILVELIAIATYIYTYTESLAVNWESQNCSWASCVCVIIERSPKLHTGLY